MTLKIFYYIKLKLIENGRGFLEVMKSKSHLKVKRISSIHIKFIKNVKFLVTSCLENRTFVWKEESANNSACFL